MYNLRYRGRLASAGSARPQVGMGVRAPPAVASQITLSQALAILDSADIAEADLFDDDDDVSIGSGMLVSGNVLDEEALQPPNLSPVVTASVELPQDRRDPPNLTPNQDFPNPVVEHDVSNPTRKWEPPNSILAPNVLKNQGVSHSLGSSLQKGPGVVSGTEGADDLLLSSQLVDELNSDFVPDTYAAVGVEGHIPYSLKCVRVVDLHRTLHSSPNVRSESEKVRGDDREIAPVGAPVLAAASESVSAPRPEVPYSTVVDSTSSTGLSAAIDDVNAIIHDDARQVSKRPDRQLAQTIHSARWPAAPA